MTPRLETLLNMNPEFETAYYAGEDWAMKQADAVLGLDGQASRRHPDRAFKEDGYTRRNWCGQCPSRDGCVMCDLDEFPQVIRSRDIGVWTD